MYKPHNRHTETLESHITENRKKPERITRPIAATLMLLGVVVGGWFAFDRPQLGSEEVISILGVAATMSIFLTILPHSSQKSCECCWLKKFFKRKNQSMVPQDESLDNTNA